MLPPRKDPIPNQDSTIIINKKYPILPPLLEKWPTEYKSFINDTYFSNKTEVKHNDSKDNSYTENEDSVNKPKVKKVENKDYK